MDPPQHEHSRPSSLHLTPLWTKPPDIPSSNYVTVPNRNFSRRTLYLSKKNRRLQDFTDTLLSSEERSARRSIPILFEPSEETVTNFDSFPARVPASIPLSERLYMSVYSSSSVETDLSEFSNPPARTYRTSNSHKMPRKISAVRYLVGSM
jgi:hypothetical protein